MKRFLVACLVVGIALSAVALAGEHKMGDKAKAGTIVKVDNDQKMMVVKSATGSDQWTIYWNADTKVEGDAPKEGAMVSFKAAEKDGKMWATWVKTGEAKSKM
jgi:hypothetical protein